MSIVFYRTVTASLRRYGEARSPGQIELFIGPNDPALVDNCEPGMTLAITGPVRKG